MSDSAFPHGFSRFVTERYPDTTQQQALGKQVREMLDSSAWKVVEAVLEAQVEHQIAAMRPPRVREHVEYAAGHAMIEGLRSARYAAEAVLSVAEKADERARAESAKREGG